MQIQQNFASLFGAIQNPADGGGIIGLDTPPPPDQSRPKHPDRIRQSPFPNWPSAAGAGGGVNALLSQIMNLLQQLLSAIGGQGNTAQPFFSNAQASSTGDPHLAFNGTTGAGTQQSHFDSMTDHPDLLDSNSFRGGFQIGTSVTQPGANGVTWNRRAAVTTNFGGTQISLDNQGRALVLRNGKSTSLAAGQSMQLGRGESVTRNGDGSLVISDENDSGGYVTTTLRDSGLGVDVSVDARGVALGGDLVRHT
jgi:hypothetical protein